MYGQNTVGTGEFLFRTQIIFDWLCAYTDEENLTLISALKMKCKKYPRGWFGEQQKMWPWVS
jgi:hypothetical protein